MNILDQFCYYIHIDFRNDTRILEHEEEEEKEEEEEEKEEDWKL